MAFCIPVSGLRQFKVVPFGAMNSPAEFKRLIEKVFAGLTYGTSLLYLDDIIVYGKTFEIHIRTLEEVSKRLAEANLKFNPEKMCIVPTSGLFFGVILKNVHCSKLRSPFLVILFPRLAQLLILKG